MTPAQGKEEYSPSELDESLLLPDRVRETAKHLFDQLLLHGGTPEVLKAGGLPALKIIGDPGVFLLETKERLFEAKP